MATRQTVVRDAEATGTSRRRRVRGVVGTGIVVVTALVAGAAAVAGRRPAAPADHALPPVARITRQTLKDTRSLDGQLGYGPASPAVNRLAGTVTMVPASGTVISRGQALYTVDNKPVPLMYGGVPAYRPLGPGDKGTDVTQLESNLAALGYGGFTIDDRYTDATAAAVRRWQQHLGLPQTGGIELGRVVFTSGPVRVNTIDAVLGQLAMPGQTVLHLTGTSRLVTVTADIADLAVARKGADVTVTLPGGRSVAGRVSAAATVIAPPADPGGEPTTKVQVVVALSDQTAARNLGDSAVDVAFTVDQRQDVLTVPVAALVALSGGGYGLELVEGTASRYVSVHTGLFADGRVEVSGAGLTEGAMVGVPG